MKLSTLGIAAVTAFASLAPASAASYLLNYTGSGAVTAALTITTSNTAGPGGSYGITGITGNVLGDVVTGLAPVNPPGFNTDNNYFNADPIFTTGGVGFFSSTLTYNLWGTGPGAYTLYSYNGSSYTIESTGTLTVANVPEPASWALLIVGFGMVGFAARRRTASIAA